MVSSPIPSTNRVVDTSTFRRAGVSNLNQINGSCPTAWCSFSGVAALISGHGRVDHAAMDDNVTVGSSLNCVTLSSVM